MTTSEKLTRNLLILRLNSIFNGMAAIWAPIVVLFQMKEVGMNLTEVMIGEAIFAATVLSAEIPSGILADRIGRKKCLVIAEILIAISIYVLFLADTFSEVIITQILIGIGFAFSSGAKDALMFDSLKELGREKEYKSVLSRLNTFEFGTAIPANILGGILAGFIGLHFPILIAAIIVTFSTINLSLLIETDLHTDNEYHQKGILHRLQKSMRYVWTHPLVRYTIFFAMILGVSQKLSFQTLNPYWDSIDIPLYLFGIALAGYNAISALYSHFAHRIIEKWGDISTLLFCLCLSVGTFGVMAGFGMNISIIGALILPATFQIVRAIFPIATDDMINQVTYSHHRATVLSIKSFLMQGMQMLLLPVFGYAADILSLFAAFAWTGIIVLFIGGTALWHLRKVPKG